ncbi:MAG: twitching motility protein PilT [Lachnospiraceae bacterium]
MIRIIAGEKGKGKTKYLLEKVNMEVKSASGSIVYLDKSTKHMYELSNKVRLICVPDYMISNSDEFFGFLSGIISQDHDLEEMYLDSFLTIASLTDDKICDIIEKLESLSESFHVNFVLSVSKNKAELPECIQHKIIVSL